MYPDTNSQTVAANTTVIATIKMVAITGLTPSSFLYIFFIFSSSWVFYPISIKTYPIFKDFGTSLDEFLIFRHMHAMTKHVFYFEKS